MYTQQHTRVCVSRMSGDTSTLSWRSMSPTGQSDASDASPTATVARDDVFSGKIIKVCFLSSSSNLGKNFKLVRCGEGMTVRVRPRTPAAPAHTTPNHAAGEFSGVLAVTSCPVL